VLSVLRFVASVLQFAVMVKPAGIAPLYYMFCTFVIVAVPNSFEVLVEVYNYCLDFTIARNERKRRAAEAAARQARSATITEADGEQA
jgi:hypothetical protein